jgi:tetratricopeptide (TPR) repeat protein
MTLAGKKMSFDELTALVQRGDLRHSKGDTLGALQDYERALKEAPDDPMIWNNRGVSLSALGRYDEAAGSYRKAIGIRPGYWMAWYNLGKAIHRKADRTAGDTEGYEEALEAYERALELNPSHTSTLNNKAVALRKLGRNAEALEVYDELISIDPLYGHAWYNKGQLLTDMGLPEEARKCIEVAAGLDPEFARAGRGGAGGAGGPGRRARRPAAPETDESAEEPDLRDVERPRGRRTDRA